MGTRSGENILCFDDSMLRSVKTLNVLQSLPMQPLSSAPPWVREVVKTYCVSMSLCWEVSKHLMFCRRPLSHQLLFGYMKWWKHIVFWWVYVEKCQNILCVAGVPYAITLISSSLGTRSGENILRFDEFMLRSVTTFYVLQGDLCNHSHQPLLGDEKWWKNIVFWWLYVEKYQNI